MSGYTWILKFKFVLRSGVRLGLGLGLGLELGLELVLRLGLRLGFTSSGMKGEIYIVEVEYVVFDITIVYSISNYDIS